MRALPLAYRKHTYAPTHPDVPRSTPVAPTRPDTSRPVPRYPSSYGSETDLRDTGGVLVVNGHTVEETPHNPHDGRFGDPFRRPRGPHGSVAGGTPLGVPSPEDVQYVHSRSHPVLVERTEKERTQDRSPRRPRWTTGVRAHTLDLSHKTGPSRDEDQVDQPTDRTPDVTPGTQAGDPGTVSSGEVVLLPPKPLSEGTEREHEKSLTCYRRSPSTTPRPTPRLLSSHTPTRGSVTDTQSLLPGHPGNVSLPTRTLSPTLRTRRLTLVPRPHRKPPDLIPITPRPRGVSDPFPERRPRERWGQEWTKGISPQTLFPKARQTRR